MDNKKITRLQDAHWYKTFKLADTCFDMHKNGMAFEDVALVINKTAVRVEQLCRMAEYFPVEIRIQNIPIGIYEEAALFPDPLATVQRAWVNKLTPQDLAKEIAHWARRFDALGYGEPPCLVPANIERKPKKTPIEEALGVDDEGMTTARKLYAFLDLNPTHYSRWAKENITDNVFAEENEDYWVLAMNGEKPKIGRPSTDYKLTARFAKKLAMTSQSEKGEMARNYFVTVEERAKAIANGQKPTGRIPSEELLNIVDKFGDRLDQHQVNRIIRLALPKA